MAFLPEYYCATVIKLKLDIEKEHIIILWDISTFAAETGTFKMSHVLILEPENHHYQVKLFMGNQNMEKEAEKTQKYNQVRVTL